MNANQNTDAVDTRVVFRSYAIVAWVSGVLLIAWPGWLPHVFQLELSGHPYAGYMVARIAGATLVAAGCFAHALTRVDDPEARREALGWWAAGHLQVLFMTVIQVHSVIGTPGPGSLVALVSLLTVNVLLTYFWWTAGRVHPGGPEPLTSLFGFSDETSVQRLRSRYEEQIRAAAGQEERNRLARDLHDSVKQQIFAIQTAAATAQARFDGDRRGACEAMEQVRSSAREAMTEMEVMLDQLRASPLENAGLVEVLKKQCEALRFRTGAEVTFTLGELPPNDALPPGTHDVVFRVAQEALANVARHARPAHVKVAIDSSPQSLQLRVEDDGTGFDGEQSSRGMGLGSMRSRAAAVGGAVAITSELGSGTLVRLSVPRTSPEPADIGYHRRRVLTVGVGLVVWPTFMVWSARELSPWTLFVNVPVAALWTVFLARSIGVWMRVRRQREAR